MKQEEFEKVINNGVTYHSDLYLQLNKELSDIEDKPEYLSLKLSIVGWMNVCLIKLKLLQQIYEPLAGKKITLQEEIESKASFMQEAILKSDGSVAILNNKNEPVSITLLKDTIDLALKTNGDTK
jgi:hypothetical protein